MSSKPSTQQTIPTPSSAAMQIAKSKTDHVQIDALVVMKIVKHSHEFNGGSEIAQGLLTGLVQPTENNAKRIEVTNCFALPNQNYFKPSEYDDVTNNYITDNLRTFRHLNVDYLTVGWYQSYLFGNFVTKEFIESQFIYQNDFSDSIALVYDPFKAQQGSLYLRAFRLSPAMMDLQKKKEFTPDLLKESQLTHDNILEELPVVIRNSHLVNALLCELEEKTPSEKRYPFLDLATSNVLEKNLRNLIDNVDDLCMESTKYFNHQKQIQKQNMLKHQHIQKRDAENAARIARGEAPLPEEDINKIFKPIPPISRLETLLISGQIKNYCQQISEFSAQSLSSMFMAEALQQNK